MIAVVCRSRSSATSLKAEFRRCELKRSTMARFANLLTQGPSGRYMSHAPDEWHKDFMSIYVMQILSHYVNYMKLWWMMNYVIPKIRWHETASQGEPIIPCISRTFQHPAPFRSVKTHEKHVSVEFNSCCVAHSCLPMKWCFWTANSASRTEWSTFLSPAELRCQLLFHSYIQWPPWTSNLHWPRGTSSF